MEKTEGISRARFLGGAVAAGAAAALGPAGDARTAQGRRGLRHRGVVYTVGEGETPATAWNAHRMRADIRAVRRDLHADTVDVTGDGVERLRATACEAAEQGLHVRPGPPRRPPVRLALGTQTGLPRPGPPLRGRRPRPPPARYGQSYVKAARAVRASGDSTRSSAVAA